ncbi:MULTISPECIES: J domain-containing protein [Synechocystis]|uniref:DnaJ domain-containing protein n=1 Tax=Synechocystis salina LEGE 00031 TaxID=1828736 RepID=A0ABR9VRH9_9SYNC|nr:MULTISPECIES: J domain-containing protein [Synechocystis]MBE9196280.1 DnaJ domain-containing protein [Synechocystis sp. LEGE 06083]MBE9240439.1 DnaJ domain-containing protein [Synechocystis salina LEGE 00041]MBE9252861.1 DnaJ domain-containing protein [Synechocystis salina LEGE 00031]
MVTDGIRKEIERLVSLHGYDAGHLEQFAEFVLAQKKPKAKAKTTPKKPKKVPALKLSEVKEAVYKYFAVSNTDELKESGEFQLATRDMELNFSKKDSWEKLYRDFVGILPNEVGETGEDCINGINIFKYFKPWQVFGLDGTTATEEQIKSAYRQLSKVYHPDNPQTGNAKVFDRINQMYRSINPNTFK